MRSFLIAALLAVPAAASAAEPAVWSVEVSAEGNVPAAELEKAAGALRAGVRAAGGVVGTDAKSSQKHLVATLSEAGDEFALRVTAAGERVVAATGTSVLLEDGAKRAATRVVASAGAVALPVEARADWYVDGRRVTPEAGMTLNLPKGSHVIRAVAGGATAMAMVEVFGGETTPFPKAALGALAAPAAGATVARGPVGPGPRPGVEPSKRKISPWVWIGSGAVAVLAAGAVAVAADSSKTTTTTVKSGPGTTSLVFGSGL